MDSNLQLKFLETQGYLFEHFVDGVKQQMNITNPDGWVFEERISVKVDYNKLLESSVDIALCDFERDNSLYETVVSGLREMNHVRRFDYSLGFSFLTDPKGFDLCKWGNFDKLCEIYVNLINKN